MRLVMMGTGPFAVPTFRGLYQTHHTMVAQVTGPIRRRGKRPPAVNPMRDMANEHNTPIFDPEDVNDPVARETLRSFEADLFVVCDYGRILSAETLAASRFGGVNLHASLLPKYRGAAPINWAVYHGDAETGVSVIHMTPKVDAGPVIAQGHTPIDPNETAEELEARLAEIGSWFVRRAIELIENGQLKALPQDPALASKAPKVKKTDGAVDWSRSAEAIRNHVRAMHPWPKTYTYWHRPDGQPLRLILGEVVVAEGTDVKTTPGRVLVADHDRLAIASGAGVVELKTVQPAGKRLMAAGEFLRGHRVQPGDRFGPE